MTIIAMPTEGIKSIAWEIDEPSQVNRSEFTGRRKVTILPAKPRWYATVTLRPYFGDDAMLAWRAFLLKTRGVANSFRVRATERAQIEGVTVLANGGGQFGYALNTDGWGGAGTKLKAGQFVTVGDQLIGLGADVVANGAGQATLTLDTYLRIPPADNAVVTVDWPTALMSMSSSRRGWSVDPGGIYGMSFACEEAF